MTRKKQPTPTRKAPNSLIFDIFSPKKKNPVKKDIKTGSDSVIGVTMLIGTIFINQMFNDKTEKNSRYPVTT